jgi:hypothetical protein
MKIIKLIMVILAAAMVTLALGGNALAFHGGGVAHCDGCHTMHNSENGEPIVPEEIASTAGTGLNSSLTKANDTSSTCLTCHEGSGGYHVASEDTSSPPNLNSGGDFQWLKMNLTVDVGHGSPQTWLGEEFGHNIQAVDFGYGPPSILTAAPTANGPGFQSIDLACSSCHDPHGKVYRTTAIYKPIVGSGSYGGNTSRGEPLDLVNGVMGNYRLLGSIGYQPNGALSPFTAAAPIAYATNDNGYYGSKVDYGSGMSEWCANCHTGFDQVSPNTAGHRHPANTDAKLGADEISNYNKYLATGNLTNTQATSKFGLVQFERGVAFNPDGYIGLLDPESTVGVDGNSNVMCLTCHRAHANGFKNMGRWDFSSELLAESLPSPTSAGATYPYGQQYGYYYGGVRIDIAATFGDGQRSLCNKCHLQD